MLDTQIGGCGLDENAIGENPKVIQELRRHANLKVTMDTYVQGVDRRKAEGAG